MLVAVVRMRFNGIKLPREELLHAQGSRGELDVSGRYGRVIATLRKPWDGPATPGQNVPILHDCRIHSMQQNKFVLHGTEYIGKAWEHQKVPQAWLCTVLPESERPPDRERYVPLRRATATEESATTPTPSEPTPSDPPP